MVIFLLVIYADQETAPVTCPCFAFVNTFYLSYIHESFGGNWDVYIQGKMVDSFLADV